MDEATHWHKPYDACFDEAFPEDVRCPQPWRTREEAEAWWELELERMRLEDDGACW